MPVRHAWSETRGRPPFSRRCGAGKNGSTRPTTYLEAAQRPYLFTLLRRWGL